MLFVVIVYFAQFISVRWTNFVRTNPVGEGVFTGCCRRSVNTVGYADPRRDRMVSWSAGKNANTSICCRYGDMQSISNDRLFIHNCKL